LGIYPVFASESREIYNGRAGSIVVSLSHPSAASLS
jgi:hypothetical protein